MNMRKQTWKAAVSAAAICAAAFSPAHAADETITSDTMLTADRTVDGVLKMSPGVVVDLNGYTLLAKGVAIANDDLTSPGGTVSSTTSFAGSTKAANLFNNNFTRAVNGTQRILVNDPTANPLVVDYDFGEGNACTVRQYKIYTGPYQTASLTSRNPSAWAFKGSNDNTNWDTLDSRTETGWANTTAQQTKAYAVANPGAYRYYRFECAAVGAGNDGYLEMVQLEYLPYDESKAQPPMIENMMDLTSPGGTVSTTTTFYNNPQTMAANLFNNNYTRVVDGTHRIIASLSESNPLVVDYDLGEGNARTVRLYKIYTGPYNGADLFVRNPSVWTLEGSNDNSNWDVLDSRTETSWGMVVNKAKSKDYAVANPGSYRYYRFKCTAAASGSLLEMVQLEYFAGTRLGERGTFAIDVPANKTTENDKVSFAGDMTFVKTGTGTFLATKTDQAYSGGTVVSNGTFKCGANGTIFGASGSTVEIASGAVLDANGHSGYSAYPLVLAGGTLKNTGAAVTIAITFANICLTADSAVDVANRYGFFGGSESDANVNTFLDLGGHTLTVTGAATFDFCNCKFDNGTIQELPGHGKVLDIRNGGVMTNNVTFISDGGFASYEGSATVHHLDMQDYIAGYTQYNRGFGTSTSRARVWGTFKPLSVMYHGLTMQNGSVLDLSEMTGPLPLVPNYVPGAGTLNFANGATVEIKVGQRAVRSSTALVSWSVPPSNIGGVTFVCNDDNRRRKVQVKDTGLYFAQDGLMLIVK